MSTYTNFCCRSGGSNLNAGTRTGDTTEPGTSAFKTYTSGSWVSATRVFTPAGGADPSADGIAVGDFVSVYPDATTTAVFIGRITAVTSTTFTVSGTAKSGTSPVDGTTNTSAKIGGAWAGPATTSGFPLTFLDTSPTNAAADPVRINFKNDVTYAVTAAMTLSSTHVKNISGYGSAYGDIGAATTMAAITALGGLAKIDGGAAGASYVLITNHGSGNATRWEGLWFSRNGGTGSATGFLNSGASTDFYRCCFSGMAGHGVNQSGTTATFTECESYGNNTNNTANIAGIAGDGATSLVRCVVHDNTGTNTSGARNASAVSWTLIDCIFDSNGTNGGVQITSGSTASRVEGCEFYNNVGPGLSCNAGRGTIENCNFVKNGTFGVIQTSGALMMRNCGFGAGTQANTSGATSLTQGDVVGSITYADDSTPWVDPANGDFRISLAAAKGAGVGVFLQTAASYAGTIGYPDVGAAEHLEAASGGGAPSIGLGSPVIRAV